MEPTEDQEREAITSYLLHELDDRQEKVKRAEKITTRRIYGQQYDVWDVWTRYKRRWWVITNPTNFYSQADFQSLEVAFTYHLGLDTALAHRNAPPEDEDEFVKIASAWRRWRDASKGLDEIAEGGDFKTIGLHCREALLDMVHELAVDAMVPVGQKRPQAGNFVAWANLIADYAVPRGRLRSHLKSVANSTWELANWLTHSQSAERADASIAVGAVEHVMGTFVTVVLRAESPRIVAEGRARQAAEAAEWRRKYEEEHGPIGGDA